VGTQLTARQQRNDARDFQDEILAEIDERYDAFMELEGRITRAIAQFDHEEARANREIVQKEQRIQELEACLERTIDHALAEGGALTQLEGALENFLHDVGAAPVEDALGRRNLEQEMQELRGGLVSSQGVKDTQIQQQEIMIGQLAASVARYEAEFDGASTAVAVEPSVRAAVADAFDSMEDGGHSEQRAELNALRERVAALSPYVEQLATADERIQQLENTCDELRGDHEAATSESDRVRCGLEQRVDELSPLVEQLREAHGRVAEIEGQQGAAQQGRADEVQTLEARVAELETWEREHAGATQAAATESKQMCAQLEQRVAELSPLADELGDARGRVQELEARCSQMDQAQVDGASTAEQAQRALAQSEAERIAHESELAESEKRATTFEQRCDSIRSKKDEQIEVLRTRVADLETVHDELGQKSVLLDEMEERCSALERSKKRAASTTRGLREELAEAEDVVREAGADPKALRRERAERQRQLLELFDELDEVSAGMQSQEERLDRLDGAYNEALCEQECDLDRLEARVRDLYLFMEAAGDVIAQLESKA
jgi:myosin heavy chain 6/7